MNQHIVQKVNYFITEIKKGNSILINELHKVINAYLYFIAYKYMKNKFDSEDLVQDFWININKYIDKCNYTGNGLNYFCKIIENLARMRIRKLKRFPFLLGLEDMDKYDIINYDEDLDNKTFNVAFELTLNKGLLYMNHHERMVIILYYYKFKTIREISKELEISKSKVDRIKNKALYKLKGIFIEDDWAN